MTQPGQGEDAGQLDLKVVADLRGFTRRLRREVNEAARKVEAKVGVAVKTTRLRTELRKAVKEAGDKAKAQVRVGVQVRVADLRRAVKETAEKAKAQARIGVRVGIAEFRRAVKETAEKAKAQARIGVRIPVTEMRRAVREAGDKAKAKVKVGADTKPARREIDRLKDQKVKLDVDNKGFLAGLKKATSAAAGFALVAAKGIGFALLGAAAAAATGKLIAFVGAMGPALQSIGILPAMAGAAVGMLATLMIALNGVGDALGQAWGAYLKLADGEKLSAQEAEKLAEAMEHLAPNARKFVLEVVKLAPALRDLRLDVQNRFFAGLDKSVGRLAKTHLPVLRAGLGEVADQINRGVVLALERLDDTATASALKLMLQESGVAAGDLFQALGPLLQILVDVGSVGATLLPNLTGGLVEATERWADLIRAAADDGRLREWISDGLSMLGHLGRLAKDVGGILRSIFGAAAEASGGGSVTVLGQLVSTLNELFKSGPGRDALIAFFQGLNQVGSALSPVLGAVLGGLGPLARIVGDLAIALSPGLTILVDGLAEGLRNLAPAAGPVGEALGAISAALAPLLPLIGAQLANVLTVVAGVLQVVAAEAGPLLELFGEMATEVAKTFLPVLQELVSGALKPAAAAGIALAKAFAPLVPVIVDLAQTVASQLLEHLPRLQELLAGELVPAVVRVADALGKALLDALLAIAPHIPDLVELGLLMAEMFVDLLIALIPVIPDMVELGAAIVDLLFAVLPLLPEILDLVDLFLRFAIAASPLIPLVTDLVDNLTDMIDTVRDVVEWLGNLDDAASDAAEAIGDFFGDVWAEIESTGESIGKFFTETLPGWIDGAVRWFEELPGRVGGALSEWPQQLGELALEALEEGAYWVGYGIGLIVGHFLELPDRVEEAWEEVTTAVGEGVDAVVAWVEELPDRVGTAVADTWARARQLFSDGVNAVTGFMHELPGRAGRAVDDMQTRVTRAFTSMWTRVRDTVFDGASTVVSTITGIPDQLGDLGRLLVQAGQDLIAGLVNGIQQAAGRAVDAARRVVGSAIQGARDALLSRSPSRVFIDIGRDVVAGFAIGMEDTRPAVRAAQQLAAATTDPFNTPAKPARLAVDGGDRADGAPLIGQLNLAAAGGSFHDQLEELMFMLRVIRRGGVVGG